MKVILFMILMYLLSLVVIKYLNRYYESVSNGLELDDDILLWGFFPFANIVVIIILSVLIMYELLVFDNIKQRWEKIKNKLTNLLK